MVHAGFGNLDRRLNQPFFNVRTGIGLVIANPDIAFSIAPGEIRLPLPGSNVAVLLKLGSIRVVFKGVLGFLLQP